MSIDFELFENLMIMVFVAFGLVVPFVLSIVFVCKIFEE